MLKRSACTPAYYDLRIHTNQFIRSTFLSLFLSFAFASIPFIHSFVVPFLVHMKDFNIRFAGVRYASYARSYTRRAPTLMAASFIFTTSYTVFKIHTTKATIELKQRMEYNKLQHSPRIYSVRSFVSFICRCCKFFFHSSCITFSTIHRSS